MNSLNRVLLLLTAIIISVSCSSHKNMHQEGSSEDSFGRVYYRNKVFIKDKNNWDESVQKSQKLVLSHDKGNLFADSQEQERASDLIYSPHAHGSHYVRQKFKEFLNRFNAVGAEEGHVSKKPVEEAPQTMWTDTSAKSGSLQNQMDSWSPVALMATGAAGFAFISLLLMMIIKGFKKGITATGFLITSLLLFLGVLYLIISASDAGSVLV